MPRSIPRAAHRSGAGKRQLRVGEEIRHALARCFARADVHDPGLESVTVTVSEVSVSPDLKNATVYVMPLGGAGAAAMLEGLRRATPYLRSVVGREVALRHVPRLRFELDTGFETATRIDRLLRAPEVTRDLGGRDGEDGDGDPAAVEGDRREPDDGA